MVALVLIHDPSARETEITVNKTAHRRRCHTTTTPSSYPTTQSPSVWKSLLIPLTIALGTAEVLDITSLPRNPSPMGQSTETGTPNSSSMFWNSNLSSRDHPSVDMANPNSADFTAHNGTPSKQRSPANRQLFKLPMTVGEEFRTSSVSHH